MSSSQLNEQSHLILKNKGQLAQISYSKTRNADDTFSSSQNNDASNSNFNMEQIDSINNQEFKIESDCSDFDLNSLSSKKVYRINEWEAAWNVTNAIQVKKMFFICYQ
jgi:hypothetical protein